MSLTVRTPQSYWPETCDKYPSLLGCGTCCDSWWSSRSQTLNDARERNEHQREPAKTCVEKPTRETRNTNRRHWTNTRERLQTPAWKNPRGKQETQTASAGTTEGPARRQENRSSWFLVLQRSHARTLRVVCCRALRVESLSVLQTKSVSYRIDPCLVRVLKSVGQTL